MSSEELSFGSLVRSRLNEESANEVDASNDPGVERLEEDSSTNPSPLIQAVRCGAPTTSSLLVLVTDVNDLDIKATDNFERNAFHHAVAKPDTLKILLEKLPEISSVEDALKQKDREGEAPIHRAAIGANVESLEILYEHNKSLMGLKTRNKKKSVLHLAVESKSMVTVKFVLSKDLKLINCEDNMSQTPIHYAASLKQTSILELLISKGACTTSGDANRQLPMHIAARNGLQNTVEILLREDPDSLDQVDSSLQSPTLLAAKHGFSKLVLYLLEKKANCGLEDKQGRTAFDWAVKLKHSAVVKVFLDTLDLQRLKKVKNYSAKDDPEECLTAMVKRGPDIARMLLDKCIINVKKESKITYDFFCLESKDKNSNCPRFEALRAMIDAECETSCLRHPVVMKYIDIKWRNRGLKCTIFLILMKLFFHTCLMVYTTRVIGMVNSGDEISHDGARNAALTRDSTPPNASEMVALRIIMMILAVAEILRELFKVATEPVRYIVDIFRWYKLVMVVSFMFYMFPVRDTLTVQQTAFGAVTVFLSWLNIIQVLKLIPVLGVYIIFVEKVFWSVAKIFFVVVIYLMSFASTFYILLAEHYNFRNIYISFVSTFVSMMKGSDYDNLFIAYGWYAGLYEVKMVFLFLFMLIMCIVVNNALIGLAVGHAYDVKRSAMFDKFRRKAEFIIRLETALNKVPFLKGPDVLMHHERRKHARSFFQRISDFFLTSRTDDVVDGNKERNRNELETELKSLDHQVEKALEVKLENLHSKLQRELGAIRDELKKLEKQ